MCVTIAIQRQAVRYVPIIISMLAILAGEASSTTALDGPAFVEIASPFRIYPPPAATATTDAEDWVQLTVRGQNGELRRPNVRDPGTDFSDYPNSAEVVPVGEFYLSLEWNYMATRAPQVSDNSMPYTFRTGVVKDLEIRVTGSGLTQENGPNFTETGFAPISFGAKWHLFDGQDERYLPAVGLESDVSTRLASSFFDPGRAIPDFSLNFDQPLPGDWSLSWNTGVTWQVGDDSEQFAQWNFPWSLVYDFNDNFEMYWHGLLNLPASSGVQEELLTGVGFNSYLGDQWSIWGNYNWGLTSQSDNRCVAVGITFAGNVPWILLGLETR